MSRAVYAQFLIPTFVAMFFAFVAKDDFLSDSIVVRITYDRNAICRRKQKLLFLLFL